MYFGDGETDIPSMKLVKNKGGHSVAVYSENKERAQKLLDDNRVSAIAPADYTEGSALYNYICDTIDHIATRQNSNSITK